MTSPSLDAFLLARFLDEPDERAAVVEASRRVVAGALRWSAEHDVPLEQTPQYATMRHLAAPYAGHPDWREEWR